MKPLRVAVVGVGHLGRHHARILNSLPGVELVAVADSRPEQAAAVAEGLKTRAVTDYHELINLVDAVSIAVPTFLHREVAGAFLEAGVPAMVEKPLAGNPVEAEELVALARKAGVVLQVGHIERFNPALDALRESPIRPKFLSAERLSTYTFRSTDVGVVHDLMIHDIDLVLSLIDAPVRAVSAVGVSLFGEHEDVAEARIEFENGSVASLTASRASYSASRKMRIWGAEGYASLDFAAKQATVVRPSDEFLAGGVDLEGVDLAQPAAVKEHLFGKVLRVDHVEPPTCDQLTMELQEFVASVRGESEPRVDGEAALEAVRLADRIVRNLNAHRWESATAPAASIHAGSVLRGPHAWRGARSERSQRAKS
ncbi:Gfo/Idh/MocA family protein [Paludisphaera rhizosphaerae]|uniref:Gfo/Idh/MocA family protein n=1 Tax=Paludisphaera rhizosphaerae TaxID=2711216 RepID=UPI0013EDF640|nr:Gfo/Idh/MocA family oxidoreductase [Paludisphaera rhizosphaerae]